MVSLREYGLLQVYVGKGLSAIGLLKNKIVRGPAGGKLVD
jgi:hypothetical protein